MLLSCLARNSGVCVVVSSVPHKVFDTALEAAVRWCAAGPDDAQDPKDFAGLPGESGCCRLPHEHSPCDDHTLTKAEAIVVGALFK